MKNKQQSCLHEQNLGAEGVHTCKQRGTTVHIFALLPQFCITVFISKFVRLHGVLSFQNRHLCLAIYGPQCESLMSHLQVRMNEAEMLYFHSKVPDAARGTNSENLGNVFVFVWAYKIKCTCSENKFCPSLLAKSQEKLHLPEMLGYW